MTTYIGLNPDTGAALIDDAQLAASLRTLLTTPIGSRLMRRDYGSRIPDLIDAPLNPATLMRCSNAAVTAIKTWEPRLEISGTRFFVSNTKSGLLVAQITAQRRDKPATTTRLEIAL